VVGDALRVGDCATQRADEVTLHLWRAGVVTNTLVERWITVRAGEPRIELRYRIRNDGSQPLDFLWKLHPALAISPDARIELPACTVRPDPAFNDRIDKQPFAWPHARSAQGAAVDMRDCPAGQYRNL
jgi:hypothetical protein